MDVGFIGALIRGLAAGVAGTAAMTAYQTIVSRIRGGGSSREPETWDDAPAPAQVGRKALRLVGVEVARDRIPLLTNVVHWSYGTFWGAVYGVAYALGVEAPWLVTGIVFGLLVWLFGYVVLPLLRVYDPIWKYDAKTLALDASYHLVFGIGVAAAFRLLAAI